MKSVNIYNEYDYARESINRDGKVFIAKGPLNFEVISEIMTRGMHRTLKSTIAEIDNRIRNDITVTITKP